MKARVLPLHGAEHAQLELLPWYVNGTLGPGERARFEGHLHRCGLCRAEVDFQTRLRDLGDVSGMAGDTALGWEAMRDRLEADVPWPPARAPSPRGSPPWRWARAVPAAASLVLALVLAGVMLRPDPYRALGASASAPAANALVVFRPGTGEAQIEATLQIAGARRVSGPTESDAYLVQIPRLDPATLDRLRAQPGVAVAESLVTGSPP